MSPSPNTFHQYIVLNLAFLIRRHLERHLLGEVLVAPLDVFLSDTNIYQPDLIFITNQRRSFITEQGIEGAPDLVVEVLSAGTARYDRGTKRKVYARTGVRELWLVDPEALLIQVHRLAKSADVAAVTYDARAILETPLLPGLKIPAAKIFGRSHRVVRD